MNLTTLVALVGEIGVLLGVIIPVIVSVWKSQPEHVANCGVKC